MTDLSFFEQAISFVLHIDQHLFALVAEYGALLPTHKSDEAATIPGLGIPLPGAPNGTVDFSPVTDILDGDKLFLLSAEEVTNPA